MQASAKELNNQKTILLGETPLIEINPYCHEPHDCDFIGYW